MYSLNLSKMTPDLSHIKPHGADMDLPESDQFETQTVFIKLNLLLLRENRIRTYQALRNIFRWVAALLSQQGGSDPETTRK